MGAASEMHELLNLLDDHNLLKNEQGIWVAKEQPAVSYPENGNANCLAIEEDSFWFKHRNQVIADLIGKFSPDATLFDIGGGNGFVSSALQSKGIKTVLIEPGPVGARNAKRRGVSIVIQATLETVGFKKNALSTAGVFDVVEHIEQDGQFIHNLHSYLVPNGWLYITVPAFNLLWSNDDIQAGHFRRYTEQSLSNLLTRNGFEVEYSGYLFSFLVPPIFLLRTLPSLIGFRKSISQNVSTKEHSGGRGLSYHALNLLLRREANKIASLKRIRLGSTVIAVARKKST